jgi:ligand-binding sensor domain-containing protein/anti-sigma regulatory factor (Ser/Thr protein kinase)
MSSRFQSIAILLLALCCLTAGAQPVSLFFRHISTENGLSHNKINCIMQDSKGFTWIGTDDGLNKYDGYRFDVFRHFPNQQHGLSGNIITDILEDSSGIFWISSADGGLTRYDEKAAPGTKFVNYSHLPGDATSIPTSIINALLFDRKGYLWMATSGAGLIRFDTKTGSFIKVEGETKRTCTDLCLDANGIIWSGREGGSYLKVNSATLEVENDKKYYNPYEKHPHVTVTKLYRDSNNDIWFGSWDHAIYKYSYQTGIEEVLASGHGTNDLGSDEATSFMEDGKGKMWIGTKNSGLLLMDLRSGEYSRHQHSASKEGTVISNNIHCLYRDKKDNLWVGTDKGVSLFLSGSNFFTQQFLPPLPGKYHPVNVNDFYFAPDHRLWMATTDGIFIKDQDHFNYFPVIYNDTTLNITKFFSDSHGNMYLGSDYSLFSFQPETMQYSLLPNTQNDMVMNRIIASRVVSIIEDSINGKPALIVSPFGHYLTYYDLTDKIWISRSDSINQILSRFNIPDNLVHKIYKDRKKRIWLATVKNGLGKWDAVEKKFNYFINDPVKATSISNNHVVDVEADLHGNLWVSTFGGGLNEMNTSTDQFEHISNSVNLLEGLTIDHKGSIWMIGNGNLHQYHPVKKSFQTFILPDLEKSGGVRGDIYQDEDGFLYVGGTGFYIRFHPDSIRSADKYPSVRITDFFVFDSSYYDRLDNQASIKLHYTENYFTIHFSAPWYEGNVYYQYMLEGVDPKWVDAGQQNTAPYTHINGGHFTFKVRATNTPGIWSEKPTSLGIYIVPPFWEKWWFYAMMGAIFLLIIYAGYRYRINELLKRQAIRNKIAQDLHDNVGSTLSSISVYSQVARIYKEQKKENDLVDTLEKISITSGEMISEMNDIVWAINPRNDSMEKIVQRMESFAKPLLKAADINFVLHYQENIFKLNVSMEKRKNFYLIFKEAVNNSMKYACCTMLTVTITVLHENIELRIEDNGIGFDPEKIIMEHSHTLSGNGLRNMKMRANEMGAKLKIESEKGKGTVLLLKFDLT